MAVSAIVEEYLNGFQGGSRVGIERGISRLPLELGKSPDQRSHKEN